MIIIIIYESNMASGLQPLTLQPVFKATLGFVSCLAGTATSGLIRVEVRARPPQVSQDRLQVVQLGNKHRSENLVLSESRRLVAAVQNQNCEQHHVRLFSDDFSLRPLCHISRLASNFFPVKSQKINNCCAFTMQIIFISIYIQIRSDLHCCFAAC